MSSRRNNDSSCSFLSRFPIIMIIYTSFEYIHNFKKWMMSHHPLSLLPKVDVQRSRVNKMSESDSDEEDMSDVQTQYVPISVPGLKLNEINQS